MPSGNAQTGFTARGKTIWRYVSTGRKKWFFLSVLIGLRVALPYIVKGYVNRTLADIPGYPGYIDDVDMDLCVVAGVAALFTNHSTGVLGTTIPLSGSFENRKTDIIGTIGGILKNAFIQALLPGLEGKVSLATARAQ